MQTAQQPVFKNAQDYIEFFRKGGEYYDTHQLPGLMIGTRPDPQAMKVLGEALLTDDDDVRDRIINLLRDIDRLNPPVYELHTPEVIALMVGPGFAKMDSARGKAMDLLRQYASPSTLSRYEEAFLKALKEDPRGTDLRLIAKAKPKGAWEEVDRLSQLPEWNDRPDFREEIRIARAALGDTKIEDEYIADAKQKEDAGDAEGLAESFDPLVQIGTRRTLQAVCLRMRSPLIVNRKSHLESIRLAVMRALRYTFPEELEMLDTGRIYEEKVYIRVEQFCTERLGVSYGGMPRPEFFTMEQVILR